MLKTRKETVVSVSDWDELVTETYGKTYSLQQQGGCMERQRLSITIPDNSWDDDFDDDDIEKVLIGDEMGVSFATWLSREPTEPFPNQRYEFELSSRWERNFYPSMQTVANDLHAKGLIEAGEYVIDIDW